MGISHQEFIRRYTTIKERMETDDIDCILIVGIGDDFNRGDIRYITSSGRGDTVSFLSIAPLFS